MTTSSRLQIRQEKLTEEMDRQGLDALVLNPGPTLSYITGLQFHLSERPILAIFRSDGPPVIVLPQLEQGKLADHPVDIHSYVYGEDPATWSRAFGQAVGETHLDHRRVGVEPSRLRVLELRLLEEAAPRAAYLDATRTTSALRITKDREEIEHLRSAVEVAETALQRALSFIRPGITEHQLASELTTQLLRAGSEPELPFSPIVAFGPATANPHAVPRDRPLREGDLILCDLGASVGGYVSDLTRMFTYGPPSDFLASVIDVVKEANEAARDAVRPGAIASDVDRAARAVIAEADFGEAFIHRTGHGIGLEVHEPPFVRGDSQDVLCAGMTFTIEPGIYLSSQGGARVEDDVVVTEAGVESLSSLPRHLVDVSERQAVS